MGIKLNGYQDEIMEKGLNALCKACEFGETCSETIGNYDDCPVFLSFHAGHLTRYEPIIKKRKEVKRFIESNVVNMTDKFEPTKEFEQKVNEFKNGLEKTKYVKIVVHFELNEEQKRILKEIQTNLCEKCEYNAICIEQDCDLQGYVKGRFPKCYY